ncbi:hypothetical protein BGZ80_003879 [Entomortierella chlamydospora]|uniref:F-box domain-containing protein n=1 Tax=Entomortierella chlamydospora TaxID=101097 RepID=A0A9P6MNH4_9FUNG|nr:hypothetical protein BGZ80_003879 [Entomortierella chlamydospora]
MHTPGEATAHALNLYEIRAHIAQFLSFSDITKAIRVCRQWNDFFHPLLFNAFKIAGNRKNPPLEVLQKYARYIHKLEFDALSAQAPPEYFFLQGCSSLTKLAFRIGNVPQYRVSDLLEENIKIPMELYDPDGDTEEDTEEDTEDSDDPDTGPITTSDASRSSAKEGRNVTSMGVGPLFRFVTCIFSSGDHLNL